ncbi:MAG: 50S ribosomal protein L32 [Holosporales bacterium]|jgi:large subunit ribosomal protein L32|nr:50S ribosomal protein L32 [Holosporales bacterium]
MAVPKKKTSKSKKNMRKSHDFIKAQNILVCDNCGAPIIAHNVCKFCSYYKGRNISIITPTEEITENQV